jgi:hypothetical protein
MTELTYLFATVAVLVGMVTSISIWAPRRLIVKLSALGTGLVFLPIAYVGFADLLSRPKPIDLEWWSTGAEVATVLGAQFQEDEAIHVWLALPDVAEPRAYRLPWSRDLAEQLQAAQREAAENQTEVRMRSPFEPSLDELEPKFYAMPQRPLPAKDQDLTPAQFYRSERNDA